MLLEFQTLFSGLTNIMDSVYRKWVGGRGMGWVVEVDGEPKAGSSIYMNRKAAIVCPLKCTNSHSSPARLAQSTGAMKFTKLDTSSKFRQIPLAKTS